MVSEIRMDKAREWLEFQGVKKWLDNTPNIDGYELAYETVVELCATYAESECSRLASRVEELERTLSRIQGLLKGEWRMTEIEKQVAREIEHVLAGAHAEEKE